MVQCLPTGPLGSIASCHGGATMCSLLQLIQIDPIWRRIVINLRYAELLPLRFVCTTFYQRIEMLVVDTHRMVEHFNFPPSLMCSIVNQVKLTKLNLNGYYWLDDHRLTLSVRSVGSRLLELDLTNCWNVSRTVLIATVLPACPRLRSLSLAHIYSVDDTVLVAIRRHLPELVSLNLTGCWRITDLGIRFANVFRVKFIPPPYLTCVSQIRGNDLIGKVVLRERVPFRLSFFTCPASWAHQLTWKSKARIGQ